jgi:NAD(P)-dependent dehydrogenase (short-subunit alcohol dehydrogenase family)
MSGKLQDRVAIVTGSSSGNGRAIALALAAEGAIVVCSDLRREAREGGYEPDIDRATDEAIRLAGGKAEFVEADAARYADVERLVTQAAATFGRLDVMVNNAGIFTDLHTIVDETEDEYDRTMAVNAKGVWLGCKFAIRQMLTQEPVDGSRGPGGEHRLDRRLGRVGRGTGVYCAAKGAVVNLTRQLAVDFAPERINVNAVCPGFLQTAMVRPFLADPRRSSGRVSPHRRS